MKCQHFIQINDKFVIINKMGSEIHMYYYQRLRDLREDKDLTQKQISIILETTPQQYSLWERGEREIPFHHIIKLADFYKVSIDYIAGRTNR